MGPIIGAVSVIVATLLYVCWRWIAPAPRLIVDERGILDRQLRIGWIRWDEIEGAYPPRDGENAIRLRLRPTLRLRQRLARRLSGLSGAAAGGSLELRILLTDTEWSAVEILQRMLLYTATPSAVTTR